MNTTITPKEGVELERLVAAMAGGDIAATVRFTELFGSRVAAVVGMEASTAGGIILLVRAVPSAVAYVTVLIVRSPGRKGRASARRPCRCTGTDPRPCHAQR